MSLAAFENSSGYIHGANPSDRQISLASRVRQHSSVAIERNSAAEACLLPVLEALGWDGMERHLFEALPHLEGVASIFELRAVLTRLNYRVTASTRGLKQLTPEQFPCLLKVGNNVCVGLGPSNDGRLRVFSGEAQQNISLSFADLKDAELYLIEEEDASVSAGFKHWSSRLFHRFRGTLASIMAIGFLANILALGLPLFVMNVYDKAIGAKSVTVLLTLMVGIAVILCTDWLVKGTKSHLQAYLGARLDAVVANSTFRHFLHLPLPLTASAPIGAQITRLKQFDGVREIFHGNLANALIDLPFSALFVVVLALIGGPLALLPAGLLALYIVAALLIVPRMKTAINRAGEAKSRLQNITVEILAKRNAIRDLSADDIWIEKYRTLSADFAQKNLITKHLSQIMQVISQMMMTLCGIGVLGFGAILVMSQSLTQGALIAVMALSWRALNPMHQAFLSFSQLGQAQQTIERINGLLKIDMERQPGKLPSLHRQFQGTVRFSNVVLRYPARQEPALRNFSLQVEQGSVSAITGPSGCGKTSLVRAVLGLYKPQMGAVLVDDLDIRQLDPGEWRHAIGYAPEHYDFFYGTIAQNFRMANPQADNDQVRTAFEDFGLHNYADLLPQGVETRLTGQLLQVLPDNVKQRILLARAFIRPASIYVLDDPAGNLDFEGDKLLMKKIEQVRGKSTVILTTYRPSHMRMADQLIYMQNGMVAMAGAPSEILDDVLKQQTK
ncbi:peptidase domain-containing ABC transporter [Labrenzia sp. PHM005]|uniref:peptidase domain-containing ABC transporter n=1 Tax=Labrenzia sp. PHM005 TaxID=2590016 RepID=UPI001140747B|nr:ATP-binding cassette domain-containing protein [Labrenzia sp. PHM005]QDG75831.1 ATP-binding cassette domain-containing protein [Labrenzia sp. PHM005]